MATDSGYSKRDYLRICDICGHRFHFSDLKPIGEMKFACPDDAPGMTALQISRYNARVKPIVVRPNKYAKDYAQTPIYQLSEAQIFNLITQAAPADTYGGTRNCASAAWAAIYMADIVIQALRPLHWARTATTVLTTCCDYLLTRQAGGPSFTMYPAIDSRYGGLTDDTPTNDEFTTAVWDTTTTIAAGIAFVKGYTVTGLEKYIAAADRCATYVRHVQSADLLAFGDGFPEFPVGSGNRYRVGGLAGGVSDLNYLPTGTYYIRDIASIWFLTLLGEVRGTTTVYGDTTDSAFFSANSGTIAEMIAELTTFATTGPMDANTGAARTGLSATSPRPSYDAALEDTGGSATWPDVSTIASEDVILAIRGLYEAGGVTAKVTEMLDWLQSIGPNSANAVPANYSEAQTLDSPYGTFDPTLCPAIQYTGTYPLSAPFTEAATAAYSWDSLGILSPMLTNLRTAKDTLSLSRRYSLNVIDRKYLGIRGLSGLSLQSYVYGPSVVRAAKAGLIYRQPPGHYPSLRGN